jgi:hypothetical protein
VTALAKYAIDSDVYREIATPKPEEPGKLKVVAALAAAWFERHLKKS